MRSGIELDSLELASSVYSGGPSKVSSNLQRRARVTSGKHAATGVEVSWSPSSLPHQDDFKHNVA